MKAKNLGNNYSYEINFEIGDCVYNLVSTLKVIGMSRLGSKSLFTLLPEDSEFEEPH